MSTRPSSFTVTSAGQRVHLGTSGAAQSSFTVTNTSAQTLKGRMMSLVKIGVVNFDAITADELSKLAGG